MQVISDLQMHVCIVKLLGCLVSRKYRDPDAHIYVNIGIHAGCLFSQRDTYNHCEFGHPDAHIHVDMGIGVRENEHPFSGVPIFT